MLSYREYELMKYELLKVYNDLTHYDDELKDNIPLHRQIWETKKDISDLLYLLQVEKIII